MAGEIELLPQGAPSYLVGHTAAGVVTRRDYASMFFRPEPSALPNWRAARKLTSRNKIIMFCDDSTGRGQITGGGTSQAINSYPMQLATKLQARGLNASANSVFGDGGSWGLAQTAANMMTGDSRIVFSGAAALGAPKVLGGNAFSMAAAGSIAFTPQGSVTKFVIVWKDGSTGRNFNWQVDGGATTQINSSGTSQIVRTTVSVGTVGTYTLTLNWVASGVTIYGIYGYDDTGGKVETLVFNMSICGATSGRFIDTTETPVSALAQIANYAPDLVISELGIINDARQSVPVATTQANITTFVQTVQAAGIDLILRTPNVDLSTTGNAPNLGLYVQAMKDVAAAYNVPVLDIYSKWIGTSDTVHGTAASYGFIADMVADFVCA